MAYFLGRDVICSMTTEHDFCGIGVSMDTGEAYAHNVRIAEVDSINASTEIITTGTNHGLSSGDPISFTMDGTDSTMGNFGAGTIYYANVTGATTFSVHTTYATGISGASKLDISDLEASTTNVTRETNGTSDNTTAADTFVFNRSYPKYLDDGGMQTRTDSSTSAAPLNSATSNKNIISDLTGIDLTFSKVDEDLSYFGQRTALKAEIKNEVTLALTKKKSDGRFEVLFNKARCGLLTHTTTTKNVDDIDAATAVAANVFPAIGTVTLNNSISDAHINTPNQNFGYRLHLQLKSGTEVLTIRNMCMTDHSVSVNVDGITEETVTFYGYVEPKVSTAAIATLTPAADL
tara:strand:+ start:3523 stop:4566 length:1044 start_codon:yes stop_codon:yes gene_type:complete